MDLDGRESGDCLIVSLCLRGLEFHFAENKKAQINETQVFFNFAIFFPFTVFLQLAVTSACV